ncbi:MAG: hypothetical protein ACRD5R_08880, partial [Candidatus Acidiferrales bacterium]
LARAFGHFAARTIAEAFQMNYEIAEMTANQFRVEVSGWDCNEVFFVEKTLLEWEPDQPREVTLGSALRPGSMVFVRLIQTAAATMPFPIAYQVIDVKDEKASGRSRAKLQQLRSRRDFEVLTNTISEKIRVA